MFSNRLILLFWFYKQNSSRSNGVSRPHAAFVPAKISKTSVNLITKTPILSVLITIEAPCDRSRREKILISCLWENVMSHPVGHPYQTAVDLCMNH